MPERVSRATSANSHIASVTLGSTSCAKLPRPETGSAFSTTANTSIISIPSQNVGTDCPSSTTPIER